jgi:NAD(P)-dependent dehydrogenase (short-subunit alcohol dehydrogenase family)
MDLNLKDKVAVITGASTGIGRAIAEALAAEGAHLALAARSLELLRETTSAITRRSSVRAVAVQTDVTRPDDIERLARTVRDEFGGLDILINNAGIGSSETILGAPDERWQYYWDLQVMADVRLARLLVPLMRPRGGGVILHNASICASQPLGHEPVYNVTKAALVMLSKCLAEEVAPYGIRVNAINPGLVLTEPWKEYARQQAGVTGSTWEDCLQEIAREKAPLERFASPEEVADLFVFLCSPRAGYCTGSTYYIDGGWLRVVR